MAQTAQYVRPPNLAWVLPRPRQDGYKGGFPLGAEIRILREIGCDPTINPDLKILHPFGGRAEFGFRVDINPKTKPDLVCDAHKLPKNWTNRFNVVFLDPPYDDALSKNLYNTGKLNYAKYTREAYRVLKPGGHLIIYHYRTPPNPYPPRLRIVKRILIETRIWHYARIVHIYRKSYRRLIPAP